MLWQFQGLSSRRTATQAALSERSARCREQHHADLGGGPRSLSASPVAMKSLARHATFCSAIASSTMSAPVGGPPAAPAALSGAAPTATADTGRGCTPAAANPRPTTPPPPPAAAADTGGGGMPAPMSPATAAPPPLAAAAAAAAAEGSTGAGRACAVALAPPGTAAGCSAGSCSSLDVRGLPKPIETSVCYDTTY
jgi:hypothetical protein